MTLRLLLGLALSVVVACTGDIGPGGDDDGGSTDPVTLAFTTPTVGAAFVRDTIEPSNGWRAAAVDVELAITGAPATIELSAGDAAATVALGAIDVATGRGQAMLIESGAVTLTAIAKDGAGATLATATVDVTVGEPQVANCRGWLDLYGASYTVGPANQGVADPVTIMTPINGMQFRYLGNANVRPMFFMDCSLARSLLEAAAHLRSQGVVEVTDIGVYNYRCIGGGTPPNCANGISQHAYAKAIDIAGFTDADGVYYSVNDDWVIDPTTEKTCEAATSNELDAFLHQMICQLKAAKVWNIVLTPNYNDAHRNHFHVDLTTGSDFIRTPGAVAVEDLVDVDSGPDLH